jgi:hypothetical protein
MEQPLTNQSEAVPEAADSNALSEKQERALAAVLSHPTTKEAALAAGISETTLWRYTRDEEFSRRLKEARREAFDHTVTRLQKSSGEAVTVLRDLMMKEDAPAAARISAARTVLDYAMRAAEQDELKARINELEKFILRKQEEDALDRAARAASEGGEG